MSTLAYGTVQLSDILTHSISHEPQWSADGVDYLWTKIVVSVQAVLNTHLAPASPVGTETAAQTMARIRHLLLIPRQQLTFTVGADTLINSPSVGTADVNQGPTPQRISITQIGGIETFLIDYTIETYVVECPAETSPPNYLSHRWKDATVIDEKAYTTRTRTGKIVCRADLLTNADQLRGIVAMPIPPGFKRIRSEYTLQEDGLALMYVFQDQEVFIQPPSPAYKATGTYIESTSNGAARFGECRVRLEGAKDSRVTAKADLLRLAITIALTKMQGPTGTNLQGGGRFIAAGAIKEELYENIVEVNFKSILATIPGRVAGAPLDASAFGTAPYGSDIAQQLPPDPGTRGSALLALARAALRDPCSLGSTLSTGGIGGGSDLTAGQLPSNPVGVTGDVPATVSITPVLPDDQNGLFRANQLNAGANGAIYVDYLIDNEYDYDYHTFQVPIASATPSVAYCRVAGTTVIRTVDWVAERVGAKPALPSPNLDDGSVLLKAYIKVRHVEVMGDGVTLKYHVAGRYVFGIGANTSHTVVVGLPPWVDESVKSQLDFQDSDFVPGIIDGAGSTVTFGT